MSTQATLAGIEPPPVQASAHPDDITPGLAVCGHVEPDSLRVRDTQDHQVVVEILVRQHLVHHPRATPVLASFRLPDLGSFARTREAADALAASIKAAGYVIAVGRGLEPGRHLGAEVLRLIRCDRLDPALPGEH